MWKYFNKYVYLKLFISVNFPKNKIIKISPHRSDLLSIRKQYCNEIFGTNTSWSQKLPKLKKKLLIDTHYKTWAVFSDHTRIFCSLLRVNEFF